MSALGFIHRIRLVEPEVGEHEVLFRWTVEPATDLYHRTTFYMRFPDRVELERVPRGLWWRCALISLHAHWALLAPCRVELPIGLDAGEREFWLRMIDNVVRQLEVYGYPSQRGRSVQLVATGTPLVPATVVGDARRAAVAFSGGKDSMALSALLSELTDRPLLVTTTSPVPWARDHLGAARERTLAEAAGRLPVELVEVESNFRTAFDLDYSGRRGCRLATHELSDVPLFQAVTIAAAAGSGITRTFMASEADIQYNAADCGDVILHQEFLSSAVQQASLDSLLARLGMRQGSLLYPLHLPQVQALLLERYPQLIELQFSCWQASSGERACSVCSKCYLIAIVTLAAGVNPTRMGINPIEAICAKGYWRMDAPPRVGARQLHETRSARQHLVRAIQSLTTDGLRELLAADPRTREHPRIGEALEIHKLLRKDALALAVPDAPGYIGGFLDWVHEDLREPLRAILDEHFAPAEEQEFARMVGRAQSLVQHITEPLVQSAAMPSVPGAPLHVCLVCRDVRDDAAGGLARAMADLAEALAQNGHRVALLTDSGEGRPRKLAGVRVHTVAAPPVSWPAPSESALHNLMHAAAVHRELSRVHEFERPIDAVIAPLWRAEGAVSVLDPRWPTLISCMTSLRTLTELDPDQPEPQELERRLALERASLQRTLYLHGLTDSVLRKTIDDYGLEPELAEVVGRGLHDRRPDHLRDNGSHQPPQVLFVGRLERRKGVDVLLGAAHTLIRAGAGARFTLAGPVADPGVLDEFERYAAREPQLRAAVHFAGRVPEAELLKLYAEADIVCIPSRYESHGIVLLEAMMFGKPIVTCPVGGIPEIISDGREALLCPPDDREALARVLRTLLGDPELRSRLGAQARAHYEARFESRAVARRIEELLRDVIERHRSREASSPVSESLRGLIAEVLETPAGQTDELAGELLSPSPEAWSAWAREHDRERSGWQRHAEWADARLRTVTGSRSWRLTGPARRLGARIRARRRR